VLGVNENMKREVLGIYNIPSESSSGWKEIFKHLKSRGLANSGLFICVKAKTHFGKTDKIKY